MSLAHAPHWAQGTELAISAYWPMLHSMETEPIDRRLRGDPIIVAGYTLRPVARLSGRAGRAPSPASAGGVWARLIPVGVDVQAPDGRAYHVAMPDATAEQVRGLLWLTLIVTLTAWLVRLRRPRRKRGDTP